MNPPLGEVPGIEPKRKKALIRQFGSVRAMAAATVEELAAIDDMTRDTAQRVKECIGAKEQDRKLGQTSTDFEVKDGNSAPMSRGAFSRL